jgi:hypothetical protein
MENFELQFIAGAVLFALSIISGNVLHRKGTPYKPALLTIHKFLSLGSILLIAMAMITYYKTAENPSTIIILALPMLFFVLGTLISGGIMSHKNKEEKLMIKLHQISTIGILMLVVTMVLTHIR